jgi:acetylglutamate kinase
MNSKKILVVKFGGHAMSDNDGLFAAKVASTVQTGAKVVIVHGGGPQINNALAEAGIHSEFVGGFRITTPEIFEIVENVLSTVVGPAVAEKLNQAGVATLAISGRHSGTLFARKREKLIDGTSIDLGLVGEISKVDIEAISILLEKNIVPVISPIANDLSSDGGLNVNADIAAAAIAGALDSEELIIMTDVPGIYRNWPDTTSLIDSITSTELESIKNSFTDGMVPKVEASLDAIAAGAKSVRIIDGRDPFAFEQALLQIGGTVVRL